MIVNFYKLLLDSLVPSLISNDTYNKSLKEIRYSYISNENFNRSFRIYSLNLGRRQGASTAIKEYIKQNPDLNFLLITSPVMHKAQFEKDLINCKNYIICSQKDSLVGRILSSDIVIFDDYELLTSNKKYKELDDLILNKLNDRNKINQVYVKFQ